MVLTGASAGCSGLTDGSGDPSLVDDRPDAVYVPTHVDEMAMVGTAAAGDYAIGLMYSYAHGFWTISGTTAERVDIQDDEDIHLMATV